MATDNNISPSRFVDSRLQIMPEVREAIRAYARERPWRGTEEEKLAKLQAFNLKMAELHDVPVPTVSVEPEGIPSLDPQARTMVLTKISVVTYLFGFALLRGFPFPAAITWAMTLFSRGFPRSFARCSIEDGLLRSRGAAAEGA